MSIWLSENRINFLLWSGLVVSILGMLVWVLGIYEFASLSSGLPTMKFNTALSFAVCFMLALLTVRSQSTWIFNLVSFLLLFVGFHLLELIFNTGWDIGQLFISNTYANTSGTMPSGTALCFILYGISALASQIKRRGADMIEHVCLLSIGIIASLSILMYILESDVESRLSILASMSIPTSVLFIWLSTVLLAFKPKFGLVGILTSQTLGGMLIRRMLAMIMTTSLLMGFASSKIIALGILTSGTTLSLYVVVIVLVGSVSVILIGLELNVKNKEAENYHSQLEDVNQHLEENMIEANKSSQWLINLLYETNRSAKIGGWEVDLENDRLFWTSMTKDIHEVPLDFKPTLDQAIGFYKEGKSRDAISTAVNNAVSLGFPWDLELQLTTGKGNLKWVRAIGTPTFQDGKCVKINGTFQDIDERKRIEMKLEEERLFLQTVIDNIPVNIYIKDSESRKILVNRQELDLMGVKDSAEVIGKSDYELFPKESADISREEDLAVLAGKPIVSRETVLTLHSGEQRWFLTSKIPINATGGGIDKILGVSVDITERKISEEKLQNYAILKSKSEEMEQFAYITSHDLREPLLTVSNYINLLIEELGGEVTPTTQRMIKAIKKGTQRMDLLINSLLDYSRLSQTTEMELVNLDDTVAMVVEDLQSLIGSKQALVKYQHLPTVTGYAVQLRVLLQNLITNALKFQKQGNQPIVNISATERKNDWCISVSDNGIGISEDNLQKIFLIFRRLHHASDYPGTGIGLAHCKKVAEIHGGKIWVDSQLGEGSTFNFTIKKTEDEPEAQLYSISR